MERPKGAESFRGQRSMLTRKLENLIAGLKLDEKRTLLVGGCKTGWSDFTTVRWEAEETPDQLQKREASETSGLEAQHSSECSKEHSMHKVQMRLDKNTIVLARYKAKFIVYELNRKTGFKS